MNAVLIIEHRFRRDKNGNIFSTSNSINTLLWDRYLEDFDNLIVIARIEDVDQEISMQYLVSYKNVQFRAIPYYVGPKQFLLKYSQIKKVVKSLVNKNDAFICRLPSVTGTILIKYLKRENIPYVVELVGDPWEVFAPGALNNPLSFLHRYRSYLALKRNVFGACGVIYVTEQKLQERYPPKISAVTVHASNVVLREDNIAIKSKRYSVKPTSLNLLSIGSLEQLYKSPDIVLKAMGILKEKGIILSLIWLGDGKYKKELHELAEKLGVAKMVWFKGNVIASEVIKELKEADLYIHASRTEGLPRAVIEAMAQGLPCIGTRVGGIPELLPKECIIEKNDIDALVNKIKYFYENPEFMEKMAEINLNKAKDFEYTLLLERRGKVYKHLKSLVK